MYLFKVVKLRLLTAKAPGEPSKREAHYGGLKRLKFYQVPGQQRNEFFGRRKEKLGTRKPISSAPISLVNIDVSSSVETTTVGVARHAGNRILREEKGRV